MRIITIVEILIMIRKGLGAIQPIQIKDTSIVEFQNVALN